jgi:hypothetical protein
MEYGENEPKRSQFCVLRKSFLSDFELLRCEDCSLWKIGFVFDFGGFGIAGRKAGSRLRGLSRFFRPSFVKCADAGLRSFPWSSTLWTMEGAVFGGGGCKRLRMWVKYFGFGGTGAGVRVYNEMKVYARTGPNHAKRRCHGWQALRAGYARNGGNDRGIGGFGPWVQRDSDCLSVP